MSQDNPAPVKSLIALAVMGGLMVSPALIEQAPTNCDAVRYQVGNMTAAHLAREIGLVPVSRADLLRPLEPAMNLDDKTWYGCATLYWVNVVNPMP